MSMSSVPLFVMHADAGGCTNTTDTVKMIQANTADNNMILPFLNL